LTVAPGIDAAPRVSSYALTRWDKIAGLALPLVAADAQAWLMQEDIIGPWLIWGYAAFGILALVASARNWPSAVSASIICGANFGCAAGWIVAAFDHAMYSYFFVWPVAIGLLVLLPLASCSVNYRRALMLLQQKGGLRKVWIAIAALCVFAIPLTFQILETRWIGGVLTELSREEPPTTIAAALRAISHYPLRLGRFAPDVCDHVVIAGNWNATEEIKHEVIEILGPNPENCESRDPHG
jgi:hypothetical protein